MKYIGLFFLLLGCQAAWSQKQEVKQFCQQLDQELRDSRPLYVQYDLIVTGNSKSPGKENMAVQFYKSGDKIKVSMGKAQDIVQSGNLSVVLNHVSKILTVNTEGDIAEQHPAFFVSQLTALVDSATSVQVKKDQTFSTYTLNYDGKGLYNMIRIVFYTQSKIPISIYTEFSSSYPEDFYSAEINYRKWDHSWKPEAGFPNMSNYIVKKGDSYQAQAIWKGYKFYQPEKRSLK